MRKTAILAASVMGMLSAATWAASGAVSSASAPASDAASKPAAAAQGVRARAAGSAKAKDGPTIALIRLSGEVLESPPRLLLFPEESLTLQQWLERFAQARNDKSIDAVALDIDGPGVSRAHAEELADAVARLNAVKPVYAFLTSPGSADYRVAMLGFQAGFPYLTGLPPELNTPRLDSPRARVPGGSIGIAGGQAGIYPRASPGGWRIIGWTPLVLWNPSRAQPSLLEPGDRVRFVPVSRSEVGRDGRTVAGGATRG